MKYRNILLGFFLLSIVLSGGSASAQNAAYIPTATNCGHGDIRDEVLKQVNEARASARFCGTTYYPAANPIAWSGELEQASREHSEDMAVKNYFSHDSLNGDSFVDRIERAGYEWVLVGENISAGRSTTQAAIHSWIKSPGHCANIMKTMFSEMGVACSWESKSKYKYFWTMDLARPSERN